MDTEQTADSTPGSGTDTGGSDSSTATAAAPEKPAAGSARGSGVQAKKTPARRAPGDRRNSGTAKKAPTQSAAPGAGSDPEREGGGYAQPEQPEQPVPGTPQGGDSGAEPSWVRRLEETIKRLEGVSGKLDERLTALEKQSGAASTTAPGTAAADTETDTDTDTDTDTAPESTELSTAAASAADQTFEVGLGVTEARSRFARALRIRPDVDAASGLTQPERIVDRLGFLAKLADRAEDRYREIADDPGQQIPIAAFRVLVARNAQAADDVVHEILDDIESALAEQGSAREANERDAYSALQKALTEGPAARLAELRSFGETPEPTTPAQRAGGAAHTNEEVGR